MITVNMSYAHPDYASLAPGQFEPISEKLIHTLLYDKDGEIGLQFTHVGWFDTNGYPQGWYTFDHLWYSNGMCFFMGDDPATDAPSIVTAATSHTMEQLGTMSGKGELNLTLAGKEFTFVNQLEADNDHTVKTFVMKQEEGAGGEVGGKKDILMVFSLLGYIILAYINGEYSVENEGPARTGLFRALANDCATVEPCGVCMDFFNNPTAYEDADSLAYLAG
ncbi:MAG: hypothetical protein KVP17_003403 [Porospora cf. gigantea B]|uniref:uncharacterized protein n=2 Tax=Porospora cf. gigantea B TaxID=2853592 RepID=UPI003571C8FB|nr:MAG: hypothetical protein KVP17_003403 [Porospora cf. gigantea B]